MKMFSIKNKKIFVLGGSGLIGQSIIQNFQNNGALVVNFDIKKNKKESGPFVKIDINNTKKIKKIFQKSFIKFGSPEVFINCSYPTKGDWKNSSFKNVTSKLIYDNLNIHLGSYIYCSQLMAEQMRKQKINGSIINFSSIYGMVAQNLNIYKGTEIKENAIYNSIKGGIISFTKQMASFYGKYNIRTNCISPGGIKGHSKGFKNKQSLKFIKNYSQQNPMKRLANVEEITPSVIFLSSDASSYINGANIIIDGGWTAV